MLKRGAGPCHDGKSEDSITGKVIPVKHLKRSGGVGGGGGGSSAPMMIEQVMLQFGVHFNLCKKKSSGGAGGRGGSPPWGSKKR